MKQTEGIDHAFVLFGHTVQTADPFPPIAQRTDALYTMGALEGRDEKVPCRDGVPISAGRSQSDIRDERRRT